MAQHTTRRRLFSKRNRKTGPRPLTPRSALWRSLETLESRVLLTGSWVNLSASGSAPPNGGSMMMLLSNGNILVNDGKNPGGSTDMYELSPQTNTGSYVNGSWTNVNDMSEARLFFTTAMLPSGKVFAVGGEFPSFSNTAEMFDGTNWSSVDSVPTADSKFGDDPIEVIPTGPYAGQILAGYYNSGTTYRFNPSAAPGSQWTTTAGSKLRGDASDEEAWVKLPDGSILSYDIFASGSTGVFHAQRYDPTQDKWVDASNVNVSNPPSILEDNGGEGREMGPGFLMSNGKVIYFGANGNTAIYDPVADQWSAGPKEPQKNLTITPDASQNNYTVTSGGPATYLVGTDDPGAVLPNGNILIALSPQGPLKTLPGKAGSYSFPNASYIYEYDPNAQTFTEVTPGGISGVNAFQLNMVMLPTGQVLLSNEGNAFQVYTPSGGPQSAWRPTISSIVDNGGGTFTLKGTQLNGIDEGAAYGDDNASASNYPIIQFKDSGGNISYGRTVNWSSNGVSTGGAIVSTQFTLPAGHSALSDFSSIVVIANGIPSNSIAARANPNVTAASNQNATEGASQSFSLGSFNDPDGSPWTVTVNWGDGSPNDTFSTSSTGSLGNRSHIYGEEGNYTATVTVTDATSLSGSASFTNTVSDPPVNGSATATNATEGASALLTVATFTDPAGGEAVGDYSATIDWGDGTSTAGSIISLGLNLYGVQGTHTYAEESAADHAGSNPYAVTVVIHHDTAPTTTVNSTVTVSDPPVSATGGFLVNATEGQDSPVQTVATFTDPGGAEAVGDYSAIIDWGDGSTSSGSISLSSGTYTVSGDHTYAEESAPDHPGSDPYTITVTISHENAPTSTAVSSAQVSDPPVIATGNITIHAVRGAPICDVPIATFTDPGGPEALTDYSATVDWGDGTTPSAGELSYDSGTKTFTVAGDHVYTASGTNTITITVHHEKAPDAVTTSTAIVTAFGIGQGPCTPDTLLIGGTLGDDTIRVVPLNTTSVQIMIGGVVLGTEPYAAFSQIAIYGQDGNDDLQVDLAITTPAFIFGGPGNDRLHGGGGFSYLDGGTGNDQITGGSGLNVLIGGTGSDSIVAQSSDDLIITGTFDFADYTNCDNDPQICALFEAWTAPLASFTTRVTNVQAMLTGHMINDSAIDTLNSGPGQDLIYLSNGDIIHGTIKSDIVMTV